MDQLRRNRIDHWAALVVSASVLCIFLATLSQPTITWDEGVTIRREAQMRNWFQVVVDPPAGVSREQFLREPAITLMWPFAREEPDGHPPFYAVIGNIGWLLGNTWLPLIDAHRLGPVILFSVTCGVMYMFMARRWGRLAAAAAVCTWVLVPRVFAHAHLASYDVPLACLWFLTVVAFWKAREGWIQSFTRGLAWSIGFAVLLAFAAATKFTGWLIPLPLLVWTFGAAVRSLQREGCASLQKLSRVFVCLAIPVLLAPFELMLVREIRQIEAGLQEVQGEDSQLRAKRAADVFRSASSTHRLNVGIYLAAGGWIAIYGTIAIIRRVSKGANRSSGQHPRNTPHPQSLSACGRWESGECMTEETGSRWVRPPRRPISATAETWAAAALVPAITVFLVPNWWHDPLRGIAIFLWSNMTRQNTTWIPTYFFGTHYEFSLPWYNTLAWIALTVPPLLLALMLLGIMATLTGWPNRRNAPRPGEPERNEDQSLGAPAVQNNLGSLAWLLFWNAATLLIIRAIPGSPGHDGERQLIGSFPFLACLAGVGAEWLTAVLSTRTSPLMANWLARGVVLTAAVWSVASIWHYRTAPLSYYTELIGGLHGAAKLGLEPTYYWDALDRQTIDWLNGNTSADEKILFCNYPETLGYLRLGGILRAEMDPRAPVVARWYVLQNRPGLFLWNPTDGRGLVDRWLAEHGRAAYTHELDGVPLIWVFPFDEYERAIQQAR